MKRSALYCFFAAVSLFHAPATLAMDCPPAAAEAYEQGQSALQEDLYDEARSLFEQAATACDNPANWQALGDAWVAGLESAEEPAAAENSALEAYGNAFSSARRAQDNPAGAAAARSIVELGLLTGDPLKAQNWLLIASQLDPEHPDVATLQAAVDSARAELSTEEIDTGFSQTRGLGRVNNLLGGGVTSSAFWDPATEPEIANPEEGAELASSGGASSSLSIPIKFESNSVNVTADTAANIENLAKVLAAQAETASFTLIGHADVRGDDSYNLQLSQQRATEIMGTLISLEPSLDGRIVALGDGESRPVDTGNTARAHANNRRLEVVISQN